MNCYKIIYTYFSRGIEEEEEMTFGGLSMLDAIAYVRQMAYIFCHEDFAVRKVYVETDNGTAWAEVPDWTDTEYQHQRYLAEKAELDSYMDKSPAELAKIIAENNKRYMKDGTNNE